jgi:hypothetical protein
MHLYSYLPRCLPAAIGVLSRHPHTTLYGIRSFVTKTGAAAAAAAAVKVSMWTRCLDGDL